MKAYSSFRRTAAALAVALLATLSVQTLSAQPFFTNPPCPGVRVVNSNATCPAQIRFVTVPAAVWPPVINVPPGGIVILPNPVPGVTVTGIIDILGVFHPFNPPPAPFSACSPTGWWISGIQLAPPVAACLFNVCADPATCTIRFL